MHLKVVGTDARIHSGNFQGHGVKGQRSSALRNSNRLIIWKTIDFLYRHIHLKVVETSARIVSRKFQSNGVKGQMSSALRNTKMDNFLQSVHLRLIRKQTWPPPKEEKSTKRTACHRSNVEHSMVGAKIPLGSLVFK